MMGEGGDVKSSGLLGPARKGREGTWDVGWTCSLGGRLKVVEKRDEQHSDEVLALRL
jgi:hypothetical protein